jgi:DNA-binding response OmpR family regulator
VGVPPPPIVLVSVTECRRVQEAVAALARDRPLVAHSVPTLRRARRLLPSRTVALLALDARIARAEAAWIRTIRDDGFDEPIVWVQAGREELERLSASGADDVIEASVRGAALVRRLEAVLRCRELPAPIGAIALDSRSRRARVGDRSIALTPREHALLLLLLTRGGGVATKDEIGAAVLADDGTCENAYFHVHNLKRKLGAAAAQLRAVRGEGYRLAAE